MSQRSLQCRLHLHLTHLADGELQVFDGSRALGYVRGLSPQYEPGTVTHHHGESDHAAFLERPYLEAIAAINERIARARDAGTA